jgi:hypothetical protein
VSLGAVFDPRFLTSSPVDGERFELGVKILIIIHPLFCSPPSRGRSKIWLSLSSAIVTSSSISEVT